MNLERLGSSLDVPVTEDYLSWASCVDEMLPLLKDKWMQNGIYYAFLLSKNWIDLNPSLAGGCFMFLG